MEEVVGSVRARQLQQPLRVGTAPTLSPSPDDHSLTQLNSVAELNFFFFSELELKTTQMPRPNFEDCLGKLDSIQLSNLVDFVNKFCSMKLLLLLCTFFFFGFFGGDGVDNQRKEIRVGD